MSFLFKRTPRTPQELIRNLNDHITKIDTPKGHDECHRHLAQIKLILNGDDEIDPSPDQISQLAQEIYTSDCLYLLVANIHRLDFDSRKDVLTLFSTLLRRKLSNKSPTVDYLLNTPKILVLLIKGQQDSETGLVCGSIMRECVKFEAINRFVLYHPMFWNYFTYVQNDMFEVATDAFTTLHELLCVHKKLVLEFLTENYDQFNQHINQLIQLKNYVVKRQSVRLLSELVLSRSNQFFLNKYFDDTNNLKLVMMLLSDRSKNLQVEGFHIFKFFIAKPKKNPKVMDVLIKNKSNFLEFLERFDLSEMGHGVVEEKEYVMGEIEKLPEIGTS